MPRASLPLALAHYAERNAARAHASNPSPATLRALAHACASRVAIETDARRSPAPSLARFRLAAILRRIARRAPSPRLARFARTLEGLPR